MKALRKILVGAIAVAMTSMLPALPGSPVSVTDAGAASACPAVQVFVDAGTYAFDEYRRVHPGAAIPPSFQPAGMDQPIRDLAALTAGNATYFTVDYPAQANTWWDWGAIFRSEAAGVANTKSAIRSFVQQCPSSRIALYGYSQGAWVAGDVSTDIANHNDPVSPSKVLATFLQADPVQTPGRGTFIGPRVNGTGVLPARYAGFGALNGTTFELCAGGDKWCDASIGVLQIADAATNNPMHTQYNSYQVTPGTSATEWIQAYLATHSPLSPAVPVVIGAIGDRWQQMGGANSVLGIAVSVERPVANGGRFVRFEHGSIYWTPQTGAWAVHGSILATYATMGWETSSLGFPTSNEIPVGPNGADRQSYFQHGSLYWTRATGVVTVR